MNAKAILICSLSAALLSAAHALNMETVIVGNPGNAPDQNYFGQGAFGAVATTNAIGKYEVTLNQYTEFLNAVADTDAYDLYNPQMGTDIYISGIARANAPGSYTYSVIGDGQQPVTLVSWFDAARFTNWLHNGQPNTGIQTAATTEDGAYTLHGAVSGTGFSRNVGSQYWIPSESEWYKAAYYQPAAQGGDADGYWLYPMQTNGAPYSDQPPGATPDNTKVGNFYGEDGEDNGYDEGYAALTDLQYALTPVGAYVSSDSYFGTFDQGGNVAEWNDSVNLSNNRGMRGGSWYGSSYDLQALNRPFGYPADEFNNIGFRVATVPEPTVSVSLMLAGGLLLARRKRPSGL